jgi:hypothetical protein
MLISKLLKKKNPLWHIFINFFLIFLTSGLFLSEFFIFSNNTIKKYFISEEKYIRKLSQYSGGLWAGQPGLDSRKGQEIFSLLRNVQNSSGIQPASIWCFSENKATETGS